jgi:iron complex transport system ATP-binding protein
MTLQAKGLAIGYGPKIIGRGLDFTIQPGTVTCLLGPNGIGKTTLFKTLLGLLPPLAGELRLDGDDLGQLRRPAIARRIAYVPQAQPTGLAYTVIDLVVMGRTAFLGPFSTPGHADHDAAMAALATLGIADLAEQDATRISGGQLQLAYIARALAQQAPMIIMDEPTASLDLGNRHRVLEIVRDLAMHGLAVVLSTHEPEQAFAVADQVVVLGRNRFVAGPVAEVLTAEELSQLYGLDLCVERTPSGRYVVSPL